MDFNATVDLIIRELNEAWEIIDDLKNYEGVPVLQIELAKSKCKNSADVIRLIKDIQNKQVVEKTEKSVKIEHKETQSISVPENITNQIPEPRRSEKTERKTEIHRDEPVIIKSESQKSQKKKSDTVTIADTFGQRTDSLNEKLGGRKEDDGVREIIKSKPITSLSEAIGINDKFLFIRELFNGNAESYNKAISNLDNSGSFSDAKSIFMNYAGNDMDNQAAKQLLDLVKRKFPVDE